MATAEVSEPPRPRVEILPSLLMPWKPATIDDFSGGQIGTHFLVVDVFDTGFGVGSVGLEGDLPAGVALGVNADVFQGHGQQADGHLFAGSKDDVEFARIGMLLHFVRQCDQSVGFAAHGGYDATMSCPRRGLWRHVWLRF